MGIQEVEYTLKLVGFKFCLKFVFLETPISLSKKTEVYDLLNKPSSTVPIATTLKKYLHHTD